MAHLIQCLLEIRQTNTWISCFFDASHSATCLASFPIFSFPLRGRLAFASRHLIICISPARFIISSVGLNVDYCFVHFHFVTYCMHFDRKDPYFVIHGVSLLVSCCRGLWNMCTHAYTQVQLSGPETIHARI